MKTRTLGRTGTNVSAIGLGCMDMSAFYGPSDEGGSIAVIHRALELGTNWRRANPRFQGDNFRKNLELVEELKTLAQKKGVTAAQLVLAWLLTRGEHVVPIPGSRRIERLEENAAAADIDLTPEELERLDEILPAGVAAGMRYPEGGMRAVNV